MRDGPSSGCGRRDDVDVRDVQTMLGGLAALGLANGRVRVGVAGPFSPKVTRRRAEAGRRPRIRPQPASRR